MSLDDRTDPRAADPCRPTAADRLAAATAAGAARPVVRDPAP